MKRWRYSLLVLITCAFMVFGAQAVMGGTLDNGLEWKNVGGTMEIIDCSENATVITIPASINEIPVTTIGARAFQDCSKLTSVTIPDSVTAIEYFAFNGCRSLTSVTIPNSVTTIAHEVFNDCSGLTSVTIPNSVTTIEHEAFNSCSSLTSVTIPNSVTTIEYFAFDGCSSLTSVTISNSVKEIGDSVFWGCERLRSVTIPYSVTSIGEKAFGYYENALGQEKTVTGFTINGYYGTCAEKYAKDNAFTFIGTKISIGDVAKVEGVDSEYDYTGDEIKPTVCLNGIFTFTEGVDYRVSYKNNKNPGTATIIVKGINNYTGTIEKTFKIKSSSIFSLRPSNLKAKAKKNKVTVSWKKIKKNKAGKKLLKQIKSIEVQYSTDNKFKKGVTTKKVGKSKTKITLKLKKKTTYYIRVRYKGSNGYSKWSSVKKVKTK